MDDHKIRFTTIDIVRFKNVEVDEAPEDEEEGEDEETVEAKEPVLSPVTIWIGVFPESTIATAAHHAAQSVLALLQKYQITDVDVDFRESIYTRNVGPRLLKPVDDLDPISSTSLVPSLLPSASASQPGPDPTLGESWTSTSLKAAAVIGSCAFHAVTSSSDSRKATSTTLTAPVRVPKTSSCSAREPTPTSSIR